MNYAEEGPIFPMDSTPSKKIVSCQINGWMETCAKQAPMPTQRTGRYLRKLNIATREPQQTSLSKLRDFRNSLLRYALAKSNQSTPHTADSITQHTISINTSKGNVSPVLPTVSKRLERSIRGVDVSEFCDDITQKIVGQVGQGKRKKHSQVKLPEMTRRVLRDVNRSEAFDPTILQNKITENQYCSSKYVIRKV